MNDGSVIGDPDNVKMTNFIINTMGWKPPSPISRFDLLPLVVSGIDGVPKLYELPKGK